MIKKIFIFICCITLLLICDSCRTVKKSESSANVYRQLEKPERERISEILKREKPYESFSAKMNISATLKGKSLSSSATIKILKNKVIQISVQPFLGIEVARITITSEKIVVLDKLKKRYVEEKLKDPTGVLPIDVQLSNLEALFLSRLFIAGEKEVTKSDERQFEYEVDGNDRLVMNLKRARGGIRNGFIIGDANKIEQSFISEDRRDIKLSWIYGPSDPLQNFPKQAKIRLEKQGVQQGEAMFSFSRIEWDNMKNVDMEIPQQYSEVSINAFLNTLF